MAAEVVGLQSVTRGWTLAQPPTTSGPATVRLTCSGKRRWDTDLRQDVLEGLALG